MSTEPRKPNAFERELAATVCDLLGSRVALADADNTAAIADALAFNRQRLGELVAAIIDTRKPSRFTTYTLTTMKAEGWTPLQVRDVIDDYQAQRLELIEMRELVRRVFAGEP